MATVRKRISELTPLNSASLDTTLLGIDGGTTYKIELDVIADAVSNRVNTLDRSRLDSIESITSSFETKGRGILSGSISYTSLTNIPQGILSQSTDLSSLNSKTGSYATTGSNTFTGDMTLISSSNIILKGPGDDGFSGSGDIIWQDLYGNEMARLWKAADRDMLTVSFTGSHNSYVYGTLIHSLNLKEFGDEHFILTSSFNQHTSSYFTDSASFKSEIITEKNRIDAILSASNANTDTFAEVVSLINSVDLTNDNAFATFYTSSNNRITSLENATGSYLTSLNGAISSSSQLTSSYDTRYVISGSITQTTWDNIASKPSGIVSGSSQLTSSYDTRYTLSSSYNTDSSSFNSRFNGLVTTGSNTFSGSQVFSGSMTVTSGQVVASLITANTSSLYLTSGSNMYVQNNGVVEITGSLNVSGSANLNVASLNINGRAGDEGGEINFAVPVTNTTLSTRVVADIYQNRFRIFDGNTNGVFIDLSKAPIGVAGELMWKASGFVNAGDYVTLGNLKARIPTSGMRSLQLATVSGTYSVVGSNLYTANNAAGTSITSPLSITTTPTYLNAGLNFTAVGWLDTWTIMDYTAFIAWRISVVIGPSFNANLITIERLY